MATATRTGERRGDYELLEVIEVTSTCDTYLATDRGSGQMVEIKVPSERGLSAPAAVELLVRRANLVRELNHPALARVLALDADSQGVPFVVEEHVRGEPLGKLIDASLRGMPLDRVFQLILPIVEAVAACHRVGVVHGRIDRDHVVVTGGVDAPPAKLIRSGGRSDLPSSRLAPELRTAAHVADARSDVWGIAALMHEMLLGTAPAAHQGGVRLPPNADRLPAELAGFLGVCLAGAPKARPQDATVVSDVLRRLGDEWVSSGKSALQRAAPAREAPVVHRADATQPEAALQPSAPSANTREADAVTHAPPSTLSTLDADADADAGVDAPRRRRRRRRAPLTDAELGVRAERSRRVRVAATVVGHAATAALSVQSLLEQTSRELAPQILADVPIAREPPPEASAPAPPEPQFTQLPVASEGGGSAESVSYRLPDKTFVGLTAKLVGDSAQAPIGTPDPESAVPIQAASKGGVARVRIDPARRLKALRAKSRGTGPKARAMSGPAAARQRATRGAIANGGATPRQVLRSVRAAEKQAVARSKSRALEDAALASELIPLGERRPRLGERPRSGIDAVRIVGEHEAERQLKTELFAMVLCTLLFFGVPLLCDPTHARAEQVFGTRVRLGVVGLAASSVIALMQMWWLQVSTREGALWPAATAFKALTLLVCFLAATYFVPVGTMGRLETTACALLPWTAGAFYLFLGIYGLSRTRYNTAQHAPLGVLLALLYGGSVIGSYRVISASVFAPQAALPADADKLHQLNSSLQDYARRKQPSRQFGRDEHTIEAELEAMGDKTGQGEAGGNAPHTTDGSEQDAVKTSEQLRNERKQRAEKLETLHKELETLNRR
jgi:hypothetical protein